MTLVQIATSSMLCFIAVVVALFSILSYGRRVNWAQLSVGLPLAAAWVATCYAILALIVRGLQ